MAEGYWKYGIVKRSAGYFRTDKVYSMNNTARSSFAIIIIIAFKYIDIYLKTGTSQATSFSLQIANLEAFSLQRKILIL